MIKLKDKLRKGNRTIGTWLSLPSNSIAEILSNSIFEWITIDLEHSSININQAEDLIRVISLSGKVPLVRLTSNDSNQIKRLMDAGSHGIIVPMVNNSNEAKLAIEATRYYPKGFRGVGLARAQKYGRNFKEYFRWQKEGPIVIVQIENKLALNNLEEIFSTKGVDGYIIGPYDLSASLGCPGDFKDKKFIDAIKKIKKMGNKYHCTSGTHVVEPDFNQLKVAIKDGFKFIAFSVDIRVLDSFTKLTSDFIKKI